MIRQPISWRWHVGIGVASVLLLLLVYGFISYRQHQINPRDRTIPTYRQLYSDGLLKAFSRESSGRVMIWDDTKATFYRLGSGLLVGIILSVIIGLLMGCYEPVEAFFLPPLSFLAKIPPTAMLAIFFVLAGSD